MDSERGEQYGPRFGTGDIIGCGLLTERRELFFTKNGAHLGVAFSEISAILYPTVGLHSPGERGGGREASRQDGVLELGGLPLPRRIISYSP